MKKYIATLWLLHFEYYMIKAYPQCYKTENDLSASLYNLVASVKAINNNNKTR